MASSMPVVNDYGLQAQSIERNRRLAELMQQSSMEPAGNPMSGGWAVPTSPFQGLNKMAQGYVGQMGENQADARQMALAAQMRGQAQDWMKNMPQDKAQMLPWLMQGQYNPMTAPIATKAASVLMTPASADAQLRRQTALETHGTPSGSALLAHDTPSANALLSEQGANARFGGISGNTQAQLAQGERHWGALSPYQSAQLGNEQANLGLRWQGLGLQAQGLDIRRAEADPMGLMGINPRPLIAGQPSGAPASGAAQQPNVSGDSFLSTLPKPVGDQVKALAEGRMAFPAGFALKSPYWQTMISMVSQYDPSFDAVNYTARAKTRSAFTAGTEAKNVTALNTVIGHLGQLSSAADKLNNTNIPAYNTVANLVASNVGDPRIKEFDNTRKAVMDELTRVWRGTGGSEQDIKTWGDTISAANSPAQLHGVIQNIGHLLESRIEALQGQYEKGMGTTAGGLRLLSPESRGTLTKLEQKAGTQPAATVERTTSKSGRPMHKVGDHWEYD